MLISIWNLCLECIPLSVKLSFSAISFVLFYSSCDSFISIFVSSVPFFFLFYVLLLSFSLVCLDLFAICWYLCHFYVRSKYSHPCFNYYVDFSLPCLLFFVPLSLIRISSSILLAVAASAGYKFSLLPPFYFHLFLSALPSLPANSISLSCDRLFLVASIP